VNVVCITSDGYLHAMNGFAYCFNKYWDDEQAVGVLCYEMPRGMPTNFFSVSMGLMEWYQWSGALYRFLEVMGWDQFVMLLDDYFLTEPVKLDVVERLYEEMEQSWNIGKIDLTDDRMLFPHKPKKEHIVQAIWEEDGKSLYHERGFRNKLFLTSLQAAIWRSDFLKEIIDPEWNAWEFESEGAARIVAHGTKYEIWGTDLHPVKYANMRKSGKPFQWRLEKGMDRYPELWAELQDRRMV